MSDWCLKNNAPFGGGGGGGGIPPGDATIWPPVATWPDLASITAPRDGDRAPVIDADGSGTTGVAVWSEGDDEWQLISANFGTVSPFDFPNPVAIGATALTDDASYTYVTATIAIAAGGGTVDLWVDSRAAARSPVVQGYALGTEASLQIAAQGITATATLGTTIATDGTNLVLTAPSTASAAALLSVTPTTVNCFVRADISATPGANGTWTQQLGCSFGNYTSFFAQTNATSGAVRGVQSTGAIQNSAEGVGLVNAAFPASDAATYEAICTVPDTSFKSTLRKGGINQQIGSYATSAGVWRVGLGNGSGGGPTLGHAMKIRNLYFVTFT